MGPLTRVYGCGPAFLSYPDLGGLAGAELDALIAGQREFFAGIGNPVEWSTAPAGCARDAGHGVRRAVGRLGLVQIATSTPYVFTPA